MRGFSIGSTRRMVGGAVAFVAAATAGAQAPAFVSVDEQVPLGAAISRLVDVDADGDPDLVGSNFNAPPFVLFNDGTGAFASATGGFPVGVGKLTTTAVADFNADGLMDVLSVVTGGVALRLGTGPGVFSSSPAAFPSPPLLGGLGSFSVDVGDVDLDGDVDALICQPIAGFANSYQGQPRLFLNDGTAVFTEAANAAGLSPGNVLGRLIDLDGDGLLDAVGHYIGTPGASLELPLAVQRNLGGGVFGPLQVVWYSPIGSAAAASVAPLPADLDGDGLIDFLVHGPTLADARWIRQTAPFVFSAQPSSLIGAGKLQDFAAVDVDGDGTAEPIFIFESSTEVRPMTGGLIGATTSTTPHGGSPLLGDVDQDGDVDIMVSDARGHRRWLYNDGAGQLHAPYGRMRAGVSTLSVIAGGWPAAQTTADIDGDGFVDLAALVGPGLGQTSSLRFALNDGEGRFGDETTAVINGLPANATTGFGAAFDMDGDSDTDFFFTGNFSVLTGPAQFYPAINQGGGVFAAGSPLLPTGGFQQPTAIGRPVVVAGDLDQDGDADVVALTRVAAGFSSLVWVFVNDGFGGFTTAGSIAAGIGATRPGLGDIDGDGDLDIAFVESNTVGKTLINQGGFVFSPGPGFTANGDAGAVRVADFDGDGDGDVSAGVVLAVNQGGTFVTQDITGGAYPAQSTIAADVDSDGDLDVFLATSLRWYLNGGTGVFADGGAAPMLGSTSQRPANFADFDRDGDLDAVTYDMIHLANDQRGLAVSGYPRTDGTARIDLRGPSGGAWLLAVSVPIASGPIATAFGLLAIDPATAVLLDFGALDGTGAASFGGYLPASVAAPFVGVPFTYQAVVDGGAGPRLTNARTMSILAY